MEPKIDFVEYKKVDLSGYTLIEGFPGLGLVGTIAGKYLVKRLDLEPLGHIETNFFVPIISIRNGKPMFPSRMFINRDKKFVVIISEQIIPKMMVSSLAKAVVNWTAGKGITKVISLEGIKTKGKSKNVEKIYGIADSEKAKKKLKEHKIKIVKDGITTGVTAMILLELSKNEKIDSYSLLGNVQIAADYKAAAECLKKLNEMLKLDIDIEPLMKEAKETQKALLKKLQNFKKTHESIKKFENRGATPMYT